MVRRRILLGFASLVLCGLLDISSVTCKSHDCKKGNSLSCIKDPGVVGTCLVLGGPHYRTFDGRDYIFTGNCTYTLVKNCHVDTEHPAFEIQISNERLGDTEFYSVGTAIIKVYGQTITLVHAEFGLVRIQNSLWNLPISLDNDRITLTASGLTVVLETDFGLSVQYNWEQYLMVTVPDSYMGKVCGLCGNFNGNGNDDLTTPSGSDSGSVAALGKSWLVPGLHDSAYCTDKCVGQCDKCKSGSFLGWKTRAIFGNVPLIPLGPLQACKKIIDPKFLYQIMRFDACMGEGLGKFLCNTIQVYFDVCQRAGRKVPSWLTRILGCNPKCPEKSHFDTCASACPATCETPDAPSKCQSPCVEACTCNEGYVLSGYKCVPKTQCGCVYVKDGQKRYLQAGESFWGDETCTRKCTCIPNTGKVECEATTCPSGKQCGVVNGVKDCYPVLSATCSISGDPHYKTFDNTFYDFQGNCTYIASKACHLDGTQLQSFTIEVENERWRGVSLFPDVSVAKSVSVEVYGLTLVLRMNQRGTVIVNDISNHIPLKWNNGQVQVYQEGFHYVISTDFGLKVTYDLVYHVTISVPSSYQGKTCGLCGNFNSNKNDDLRLPDGKETKDTNSFGDAWIAPGQGACSNKTVSPPRCAEDKERVFEAKCSIIANPGGPFAACHKVLSPNSYFSDCVYDVCVTEGDYEVLCESITAYVQDCQSLGVAILSWRTPSFCPRSCPVNSFFQVCAEPCATLCPGLEGFTCPQQCAEGCACSPGFYFNGTGCVHKDQCGCYSDGITYEVGESVITEDCRERLTCLNSGHLKREPMECNSDETCRVQNHKLGCYPKPPATCSISGDPHYKTFDNTFYNFQGNCTYIASKACNLDGSQLQSFTIEVENERWRGVSLFPDVSVAKSVSVEVYGLTLVLRMNQLGTVIVNDISNHIPLKWNNGQVQVYQEGFHYVISTDFGLKVTYDLVYHVTISVPSSYQGKTCGLCGNFNSNKDDDLRLPDGKETKDTNSFGDAWIVPGQGVYCNKTVPPPRCAEDKARVFEAKCSIITNPGGPFAACHKVLSPNNYFSDCVYDVCVTEGDDEVLCESITAYVQDCQSLGVAILSWRTPSFCPRSCPVNSFYQVCAEPCATLCPGLEGFTCPQQCAEGCACSPGFYFNGTGCVHKDQCGCYSDGITYEVGESVITEDCRERLTCLNSGHLKREPMECNSDETCRVQNHKLGCYPKPPATCSISGDPHYKTFDNTFYNFQGNCTYIASKACNLDGSQLQSFTIEVENERWRGVSLFPDVSVAKSVSVEVYGLTLVLRMNQLGTVIVNDISNHIPLKWNNGQVQVYQEGFHYVISTDFGLKVTYDLVYHVTISVPSSYQGKTCGLCGNFNSNKDDDLRLPDGKETKDTNSFGDAWIVPGQGVYCNKTVPPPRCAEDKARVFEAKCSIITNPGGPFAACHKVLSPNNYFSDCVYDVCVTEGDDEVLCESITAYVQDCQSLGVAILSWRTPSFCPRSCPVNSFYQVCAEPCATLCPGLEGFTCPQQCAEGCACSPGFYFNGTGCVHKDQCGCYSDGITYEVGESVITEDCRERLTCLNSGHLKREPMECNSDETCRVQNHKLGCYPKPPATCSISGDPHYKTFDNTFYNFQGNCTYIASKACHLDGTQLQSFTIEVENERWRGVSLFPDVSVAKSVSVEVYGLTLVLRMNQRGTVIVNDISNHIPLKWNNGQVQVYQEGFHYVISTDFGLKVTYDLVYHVTISVPSSYQGKTCGLCGNFNSNKDDDLRLPDGKETKDTNSFGDAWIVPGQGVYCNKTVPPPRCAEDKARVFEAKCSIITNPGGPFAACHKVLSPNNYFSDCVYDVCVTEGDDEVLCESITAYVQDCQSLGVAILSWRTPSFCPRSCPVNSFYQVCAEPCATLCPGLEGFTCPQQCAEGCACSPGFYFNGTGCVHKDQCGCYSDGITYEVGESVITEDCRERLTCLNSGHLKREPMECNSDETCRVQNHKLGCYPKPPATCSISGDPHYKTFDNTFYNFQGNCTYIASKACNLDGSQLQSFTIEVENERWRGVSLFPDVSVAKSVSVEVYGLTLVLRMNQLGTVIVNDISNHIPLNWNNGQVQVYQEGFHYVISTDFGLKVTYDLVYHVTISVPSSYQGKTCGLCGNFNSNKDDDLRLPDGKETKDTNSFGDAWIVPGQGVYCNKTVPPPRCAEDKARVFEAKCSIITNPGGPFAACHKVLSPNNYFSDCVYDVCVTEGDDEVLCESITAYVQDCQSLGVAILSWRTPSFCPRSCPVNSFYQVCAEPCATLCPGLEGFTCPQQCAEGCACSPGFYFNGTGCVHKDQCGCYSDGITYEIGQSVITDDCLERVTCLPSGEVKREKMTCRSDEICQVQNHERRCYPKQCTMGVGGSFSLFSGEVGTVTATGPYELIRVCDVALAAEWFRVVVELQSCSYTNRRSVTNVYVFYEEAVISVNSKREIWANGRKISPAMRTSSGYRETRSNSKMLSVKLLEDAVVIKSESGLTVSYNQFEAVTVTVSEQMADQVCGACGILNDKFSIQSQSIQVYMDSWTAYDFPTCGFK